MSRARTFEQVAELDEDGLMDFFENAGMPVSAERRAQWQTIERAAAAGDADAMRQVEKLAEARLGLA